MLANDTPVEATLVIWSMKHERVVVELPMTSQPFPDHPTSYQAAFPGEALAISGDGRYVAAETSTLPSTCSISDRVATSWWCRRASTS